MNICNTPIFNVKIKSALRKIKRNKIKTPSDGSMINIINKFTRKGKWQVEYINDSRFFRHPYIAAYFFKNAKGQSVFNATSVKYYEI